MSLDSEFERNKSTVHLLIGKTFYLSPKNNLESSWYEYHLKLAYLLDKTSNELVKINFHPTIEHKQLMKRLAGPNGQFLLRMMQALKTNKEAT
jgi:hypothetical protein